MKFEYFVKLLFNFEIFCQIAAKFLTEEDKGKLRDELKEGGQLPNHN